MPQSDSLDKIIGTYLAAVTQASFEYRGQTISPKPLKVSPLILRGFVCPSKCGGCCPKFSLDYLPSETKPQETQERLVDLSHKKIRVFSDFQESNLGHHCQHLDKVDGRCTIYDQRPFSCDFELIRFTFRNGVWYLNQKLFGRGWAMQRVDGQRGAKCYMIAPTDQSTKEVIRKLERLELWASHFGIKTRISMILDWISTNPTSDLMVR